MPAAGMSPEEWIGQDVIVTWPDRTPSTEYARFDGISDWGVILTATRPFQGELVDMTSFHPWGDFSAIRLAREEERRDERRPSTEEGPTPQIG